jgi:hypothetical protein
LIGAPPQAGLALGLVTVVTGVVFLVDMLLAIRHMRINIST